MSASVCVCVCVAVCLSVCLSKSISPEAHAQSLPTLLCLLHMAVARFSSSDGVTQSQGEGAILRFFFPIDYALYGPHSSMNFATKDQFRLNLFIYRKVWQNCRRKKYFYWCTQESEVHLALIGLR